MNIQFEVDGTIVEASELAELIGGQAAEAMRRLSERLKQQPPEECEVHRESPFVTITLSSAKDLGVRVSGCCQPYLDRVQQQMRQILVEAIQAAPVVSPGMSLLIGIQGVNKTFAFDLARVNRLVIGRVDPDTGERPDIDLSAYGAYENGVSRRHAAILVWNRSLFVVDEGSPNGTFLNEKRLAANEPHPLKFGDHLRIGRLVLGVSFDNPYQAAAP